MPDEPCVGGQPVGGEGVGEARVPFADGPDVIAVAQVADPAMALVDQMLDRLERAPPVVHQHRVGLEVVGGPVDADHLDAERLLFLQEAVTARDRHHDQAVHPAGAERGDHLTLPGQAVIGAADQHHAVVQPGGVLHRPGQRREEGVGQIVDQQADGLAELALAA